MAIRLKIDRHPGVAVVSSADRRKFLLGMYDDTYFKKTYRRKVNVLGGHREFQDASPLATFRREIVEEFRQAGEGKFASERDLEIIRNSIINNAQPYFDLWAFIPASGAVPARNVLCSVFYSIIPEEIFDLAKRNIAAGNRLINEGLLRIVHLKKLIEGTVQAASFTPHIIRDYTGEAVPDPERLNVRVVGMPRESFEDYHAEFNYNVKFG